MAIPHLYKITGKQFLKESSALPEPVRKSGLLIYNIKYETADRRCNNRIKSYKNVIKHCISVIKRHKNSVLTDDAQSSHGENSPRYSDFLIGFTKKATGLTRP